VRNAEPKYKARSYLPSFLVDAMLGNIARKLRIFGYDTLYLKDTSDTSVLGIALREKRILLTRDKELFRRVIKEGIDGMLLEQYDEIGNIAYILSKCGIPRLSFDTGLARCSNCNVILTFRKAIDVAGSLPMNIVESNSNFFQCMKCGRFYWEGKHVNCLRLLAERINSRIEKHEADSNVSNSIILNKRLKSPRKHKPLHSQDEQNSRLR
jgi:uncharacterized protein with PIN domain